MIQGLGTEAPDSQPASWKSLPRKDQLCVLALCRVFDFMQIASFQTVCYYQLKSFDPSLSEETIAWQTGLASSSFSGAQIFTTMIWGRVADAQWGGRKMVLMSGLLGTSLSCVGLAFSRSFLAVVLFRSLGGASNGTVGTIRTMISENIKERKHQSRAFLLLPASFMIASVIGPVCGSWLSDFAANYPTLLEYMPAFGSRNEVNWLLKFPYALPALLSAFSMLFIAVVVFLVVDETLEGRKAHRHLGRAVRSYLARLLWELAPQSHQQYSPICNEDEDSEYSDVEMDEGKCQEPEREKSIFPFRKVATRNVLTTLSAQAIFDFHMGAFGSLLPLFLSTPRSSNMGDMPLVYNGGLGMEPRSVGLALAILGAVGIALQFLVYPLVNRRLGTARCFQIFCILFPVAYGLAPLLVVPPVDRPTLLWLFISLVLVIHTTGRIFVLPATIVLINNCAPDPSVLGTIHGIGQTVSVLFRTLGPVCSGYVFGVSSEKGITGAVWWILAAVAITGWFASLFVWERPESSNNAGLRLGREVYETGRQISLEARGS